MRKTIPLSPLVSDGKTIFFPRKIQEGDHAVVKQVEKRRHRMILGAKALFDEFAVIEREDPERSVETHEIHGQLDRAAVLIIQAFDLAGGEGGLSVGLETGHFAGWRQKAPYRFAVGHDAFEQADGLVEVELVWNPFE